MPVNRQPTEAEQLARTAYAKRLGPASPTVESLDIPKHLKIEEPVAVDLRNEVVRRSLQYAEKGAWAVVKKKPQPAHWPPKQCLEWLVAHPNVDQGVEGEGAPGQGSKLDEEPAPPPSAAPEAESNGSAQKKRKARHGRPT